jgi:hypothetical protein
VPGRTRALKRRHTVARLVAQPVEVSSRVITGARAGSIGTLRNSAAAWQAGARGATPAAGAHLSAVLSAGAQTTRFSSANPGASIRAAGIDPRGPRVKDDRLGRMILVSDVLKPLYTQRLRRTRQTRREVATITDGRMADQGKLIPEAYEDFLRNLKERIRAAQVRAGLAVNRKLVLLYWSIGNDLSRRQRQAKWGDAIIDRVAADLRAMFPR